MGSRGIEQDLALMRAEAEEDVLKGFI